MKHKNGALSVGFLFDDTLDSSDGVAQHVKTLGAWLSGAGHEVSYLVGETELESWAGGRVFSLARNLRVIFNGNRLTIPAISRKYRIKKVLADNHFDVLHVMVPYSPFLSQRVINIAPAATAIVGTFHIFPSGTLSRSGTKMLRYFYRQSLKRIDNMISVSQPAADFCLQTLGVPSTVIPNPVDTSFFTNAVVPREKYKRIVFLGRLVKRKGCAELIKAFAAMDLPESRLVVAGDGPQRQALEDLAEKLEVNRRVIFLGKIDESDKPDLLSSADVACFPSLYGESFGIVLVEAMAAGAKTILGGDNPGYRSILGGQPDCLVNPLETKFFAKRLEKLLKDTALQKKIQTWQGQTVKQYDISVVGPEVVNVYREAIARLRKNGHNESHE